jgi:hypothetical protein
MYRWYVHDPIRFERSIRWTVEHGHANNFANEYSSVAYWYQSEPHARFPKLPDRDAMRPPFGDGYEDARAALFGAMRTARDRLATEPDIFFRVAAAGEPFYRGDWAGAIANLSEAGLA